MTKALIARGHYYSTFSKSTFPQLTRSAPYLAEDTSSYIASVLRIVVVSNVRCLGGSGVRLGFGLGLVCNWLMSSHRRLGRGGVLFGGSGVLRVLGRVSGVLGRVLRLLSVLFRVLSRHNVRSCVDRARDITSALHSGSGHSVGTKTTSIGVNRLDVRSPGPEFVLGNIQDFSCSLGVSEGGVGISGNDGSVVNEVEQLSCVLGQKNLLLCALNDGSSVNVVSLLELLAGDVGKLSLGDKGLSLCADKLLLERDNLG